MQMIELFDFSCYFIYLYYWYLYKFTNPDKSLIISIKNTGSFTSLTPATNNNTFTPSSSPSPPLSWGEEQGGRGMGIGEEGREGGRTAGGITLSLRMCGGQREEKV